MSRKKVSEKSIEQGKKNLIPLNKRSPEEKRAIIEKASAARTLAAQKRKTIKEVAEAILKIEGKDLTSCIDNEALKEKAAKLDLSIYDVMYIKMIDQSLKGSVKAFETVRDSAGDKPITKTETDINIINESDHTLLNRIANRLGIETSEVIDGSYTEL